MPRWHRLDSTAEPVEHEVGTPAWVLAGRPAVAPTAADARGDAAAFAAWVGTRPGLAAALRDADSSSGEAELLRELVGFQELSGPDLVAALAAEGITDLEAFVPMALAEVPDELEAFDEQGAPGISEVGEQEWAAEQARLAALAATGWVDATTWPAEEALAQYDGPTDWGAVVLDTREHAFVDERFTRALEAAGLTDGWTTVEVPLFTTENEPRTGGHRLLAIRDRVDAMAVDRLAASGEDAARLDGEYDRWNAIAAHVRDADGLPPLARGASWVDGIYASPEASAALREASLPGLRLVPALFTDELDAAALKPSQHAGPTVP